MPALDGAGVPCLVQGEIRFLHLGGDPGSGLAVPPRGGTALYDLRERGVLGRPKLVPPQAAAEAPRDPELGGDDYGSRIRRPPEDRTAVRIPGKDPPPVGLDETFDPEVAANREWTIAGSVPGVRKGVRR